MAIQAFHSFWSRPNSIRNDGAIDFPDFEILTTILSALKWKENNGSIRLITDTPGKRFFTELGITFIWDQIETSLDDIEDRVDPLMFWAAGKLYALRHMETPCVMLDTDLIIWDTIEDRIGTDIVAAHYEELYPEIYPDPRGFRLKEGYRYPKEWDFTKRAANTAFLYIRDKGFREYYVDSAITFLQNVKFDGLNPVTAMCCAEQRLLPMCADAKGQEISYLIDICDPNAQSVATHTWGFKDIMRRSSQARDEFCTRCADRILWEYPEQEELLMGRQDLRMYADQARQMRNRRNA